MRSDIIPGGNFPDYALPDHTGTVRTSTPGLREAWNAGDYSRFHGWDRRSGEPVSAARPGATDAS